jgi:hypothetical protein
LGITLTQLRTNTAKISPTQGGTESWRLDSPTHCEYTFIARKGFDRINKLMG